MAAKKNGKSPKKTSKEPRDPRKTLIVISDTGVAYRVTNDQWQVLPDPGATGIVNQMTAFGSYLSFFPSGPKAIAAGFGELCTVVNLKAILENNPSNGATMATRPRKK